MLDFLAKVTVALHVTHLLVVREVTGSILSQTGSWLETLKVLPPANISDARH